jgi:radical SAM superfamily enzyme YgiQ (UPF0313 family)
LDWNTIARARRRLSRESGTIMKDWGGRLPVALVYPSAYYVGMSNLGVHVIYRLFNEHSDVVCERVFYDENDDVPVSVESQRPLADFAVLAFSLSFELDYLNLVSMLRRSHIPLSSNARDQRHPLLIAGGPCVISNPEPLAPIMDAFAIGEGESIVPGLVETFRRGADLHRHDLLGHLAALPGLYVPRVHAPERGSGNAAGDGPTPGAPHPIQRQWLPDLDGQPASSVVLTEDTEFGDMYLMEVTRGCGRGCHFCLASVAYSPVRERSPEVLLSTAKGGLTHRATLGLIGASLSDYTRLEDLVRGLRRLGARLSVASLRVDPLPGVLLEALAESGTQTVTIAPEAGSERLRKSIRKGISTEDIMSAVERVAHYDFPQLKLYFMIGLPGEDDSDVGEIVGLLRGVRRRFRRRITVNVTPFVPKAQTPFERASMAPRKVLEGRFDYLKKGLRPLGVETTGESPRRSEVQGVLARGDRLVGETLMALDGTRLADWRRALSATGLRAEGYLAERPREEVLPWFNLAGQACPRVSVAEAVGERAS